MVIDRDKVISNFDATRREFGSQVEVIKTQNSALIVERDKLRADIAAIRSAMEAERSHHNSEFQRLNHDLPSCC